MKTSGIQVAMIKKSGPKPYAAGDRRGLFAAGGLTGALLASSCCILPLLLVTLGIGGAWLGALTALEPYRPYFVAVAIVLIALGYWQVYFRPRRSCAADADCARAGSSRMVQGGLWFATAIVLLVITIDRWAPWLY
jgi:mercuric ion transport protein